MNTYRIKSSKRRHPVKGVLGRDRGPVAIKRLSPAEFFRAFFGPRSDHPGRRN